MNKCKISKCLIVGLLSTAVIINSFCAVGAEPIINGNIEADTGQKAVMDEMYVLGTFELPVVEGDLNYDGVIDLKDANYALKCAVGIYVQEDHLNRGPCNLEFANKILKWAIGIPVDNNAK